MKIIMLVGVPGSGKSTYAKKYVANPNNRCVRVNKDELRQMLNSVLYDWRNEHLIEEIQSNIIRVSLEAGHSVMIDNTNLSRKHYNRWSQFAKVNGYDFEVMTFDPGVDICIERDKLRERSIGEDKIRDAYKVFLKNWCNYG